MDQDRNLLKRWFHTGYYEALSRFHDDLSLSNLLTLADAGSFLGLGLLLASMGLSMRCAVSWQRLSPLWVIGAGMLVLAACLRRALKTQKRQEKLLAWAECLVWLFWGVLFALAFYYDFFLRPADGDWALCLALLAAGALFYVSPRKSVGALSAVVAVFFLLQYRTTGHLVWMTQEGRVVLAAVVGLFFSVQKTRGTLAALLQRERTQTEAIREQETRSILRQLQPHFLYNALASIQYLCGLDQKRAQSALGQFCQVLRGNMGSIGRRNQIPFERELEHTKNYIELEQLRFGDRIAVHYDVQAGGFLIPALTLQSVVENSIKHGLCNRKYGGVLTIRCQPVEQWIEITVEDRGNSQETIPNDSWQTRWQDHPNHIGLETVKARLQAATEGTVLLNYEEGIGGVVTVRILKEEVEHLC